MLPDPTHPIAGRAVRRGAPLRRRASGFTLIELVTILGVIGIMVALAATAMTGWSDNQRLNSSAREIATVFSYARGEAIRTGNVVLVYIQNDADGNALANDALVHNDGQIGTLNQNCAIDAGEDTRVFDLEPNVGFGVSFATAAVPTDTGGGALGNSTFLDAGGNPASWVMFRPEGMPLAFSSDCSTGNAGSGGGAIYLTNTQRDVAVVVSPLGSTRTHSWDKEQTAWSQ